jgi:hypothetical protein
MRESFDGARVPENWEALRTYECAVTGEIWDSV